MVNDSKLYEALFIMLKNKLSENDPKYKFGVENIDTLITILSKGDLEQNQAICLKIKESGYKLLSTETIKKINSNKNMISFIFNRIDDDEDYPFLLNFFELCTNNLHIKFKNILRDLSCDKLSNVFKLLAKSNIISLNLSYSLINDNAFKIINNAFMSISFSSLEKIDMSCNAITSTGFRYFVLLFLKGKIKNIRSFNFYQNRIDDNGFKEIKQITEFIVEEIDLSKNNISDEGIQSLCDFLEYKGQNLKSINLLKNAYQFKGYTRIMKLILFSKKLKDVSFTLSSTNQYLNLAGSIKSKIYLDRIYIEYKTNQSKTSLSESKNLINELTLFIKACQQIKFLYLRLGNIDNIELIFTSLKLNRHLISLDLSYTYFNSKQFICLLSNLKFSSITRLSLFNTKMNDDNALFVLNDVKNSKVLKILDIGNNHLTDKILSGVNDIIYESSIEEIDLSFNLLTNFFGNQVLYSLSDTKKRINIKLQNNLIDTKIFDQINSKIILKERQ